MSNISNAAELRDVYLHVYASFATSPSEVAEAVEGVGNVRFARELLGTLGTAGLITQTEDGDGELAWQTYPHTYDNISQEEAEAIIDKFLGTATNKETTTMNATAVKARPATKSKEQTFHPCYCGCGVNVPSKSFYRPGHDARHAGEVGRKVAAALLGEVSDDNFNSQEEFASALLQDLPSERLVSKAQGIAQKAIEKGQAKRAKAGTPVEPVMGIAKVGKNEVIARRYPDGKVEVQHNKTGEWKSASKAAAATFSEE